jgi:RNA polymerase sporulation-specific sigma factor
MMKLKSSHIPGVMDLSAHRIDSLTACDDAQLAALVKEGDAEAFAELTERYISFIRAKVSPYHAAGVESEDLCQEGLLGLLLAAESYNPERGALFRTYADVCISNRVIMAYRSAMGKKNSPLSNFVSLSGEDAPDFPADCSADPQVLVDNRESFEIFQKRLEQLLTPMEQKALRLYLSGCSYREIAEKMSVTEKAADNALQRVRSKLRHAY